MRFILVAHVYVGLLPTVQDTIVLVQVAAHEGLVGIGKDECSLDCDFCGPGT
jgi:hypothetical protein